MIIQLTGDREPVRKDTSNGRDEYLLNKQNVKDELFILNDPGEKIKFLDKLLDDVRPLLKAYRNHSKEGGTTASRDMNKSLSVYAKFLEDEKKEIEMIADLRNNSGIEEQTLKTESGILKTEILKREGKPYRLKCTFANKTVYFKDEHAQIIYNILFAGGNWVKRSDMQGVIFRTNQKVKDSFQGKEKTNFRNNFLENDHKKGWRLKVIEKK